MEEKSDLQFGRTSENEWFAQTHQSFIDCLPNLNKLLATSFLREYSTKLTSQDFVILSLSKLCSDNFEEIILLCTNGYCDGALVILRSMFEKLVNARYLHVHPEKTESFLNFFFVHMRTVKNLIKNIFGEEHLSDYYKTLVETNFDRVRHQFSYKTSKNKEKTRSSWSDKGLVDMALEVGLKEYLVLAYYLPIERAHPSVPSVMSQAKDIGDGKRLLFPTEREEPRRLASAALMIAHKLLIEMFVLQHEHFQIDALEQLIGQALEDYRIIWGKHKTSSGIHPNEV